MFVGLQAACVQVQSHFVALRGLCHTTNVMAAHTESLIECQEFETNSFLDSL